MRLSILGSTRFKDYSRFCQLLVDNFDLGKLTEIIISGNGGVDMLAARFCIENNKRLHIVPIKPRKYFNLYRSMQIHEVVEAGDCTVLFYDTLMIDIN